MLFATPRLIPPEPEVVKRINTLRAKLRYAISTPQRWTGLLRRNTFARAIQGSNTIEGYNVTIDDAVAAAENEEPFEAEKETWAALTGYRNAMTYILQLADDPHFEFNEGLLRGLHYMMLGYDLSKHPGMWRPGPVFVRHEQTGKVVYEGPDADAVPELMAELIEALNSADGDSVPVMIRAAMGHLNLTMVHPFSDGNGRMARALQTLILAREGILSPAFCSIEEYLGRNTQAYYDVLAEVGAGSWHPERDSRPWMRFCLTAHFRQAYTLLKRTREMGRIWDEIDIERLKYKLHERTEVALVEAAYGLRIRNSIYRKSAEVSEFVAGRDLKKMVDCGLLIPHGERRGRYYVGSNALLSIRQRMREPRTEEDPFVEQQPTLPGISAT